MMNAQHVLTLIEGRQSVGLLTEPAPNASQLEQAIQAALAAPDHHRLRPWRFIAVSGDARLQMGEVLVQALQATGETDPMQLERVRVQPLRAPLILMCVTVATSHPKVPMVEQVLSTGAAIQNLLLMLHVQGFAAMWRTGALVGSKLLKSAFDLADEDEIAGLVYIGTAAKELVPRQSLVVKDFLSAWSPTV
jgi:nitroreductase